MYIKNLILVALLALASFAAAAQDQSTSGGVTRRSDRQRPGAQPERSAGVTERMQLSMQSNEVSDADLQWMRVIYRQLDLTKDANTPLYYPDEPIDGQESLFRIIMRLLANNEIPAYEYLDGREVFTDQYRIKVSDMLNRFHVLYTEARGSNERNPRYEIDDSDVPANEVLNYYIIERWEFDRRTNRMNTRIEAICPVLSRSGDFGGEAVKYPMFWVKMDDLRPYLSTQNIFTSDDNNLATCTYADYFALNLYDGDIYKTRNLRNQSLMQLHPDPDDLRHAQDSIQNRLMTYEDRLWVPTLEELAQQREARELPERQALEGNDSTSVEPAQNNERPSVRSSRSRRGQSNNSRPARVRKPKPRSQPSNHSNSSAGRSVRNRRR